MPNYCSNTLLVEAANQKTLTHFKNAMKSETEKTNSVFSLNKLCPMPKSLMIEESSNGKRAYTLLFGTEIEKQSLYQNSISSIGKNIQKEIEKETLNLSEKDKELATQIKFNKETYGFASWYDWAVNNWGTKWDVEAEIIEESDTSVSFSFESAWAPPVNAILNGSKNFPGLKFDLSYREEGMDFIGRTVIEEGQVLSSLEGSLSERSKTEFVFSHIIFTPEKQNTICILFNGSEFKNPYDLEDMTRVSNQISAQITDIDAFLNYNASENPYKTIWEEDFMDGLTVNDQPVDLDYEDLLASTAQEEMLSGDVKIAIQSFLEKNQLDKTVVLAQENNRRKTKI